MVTFDLYLQVFPTLGHKPVTVDLAIGSEKRLKIFFSSADGYHIIDAETEVMSDVTLPNNVRSLEITVYQNLSFSKCQNSSRHKNMIINI